MNRITGSILVLGSGARAALCSLAFVAVAGVSAAQSQFEFRSTRELPAAPSVSTAPAAAGARTAPAGAQGQRAGRGERAGRGAGAKRGGGAGAGTKPPPSSLDLWSKSGGKGRGRNGYGSMGGGRGMGGMGGMSMGGMSRGMGGMGGMSMGGMGGGMGGMGRGMGGMGGMGMMRQSVPAKLPERYTPPTVTASGPIFARGISAPSASGAPAGEGRAAAAKPGKQRAKPANTDAAGAPIKSTPPAAGAQPSPQVF